MFSGIPWVRNAGNDRSTPMTVPIYAASIVSRIRESLAGNQGSAASMSEMAGQLNCVGSAGLFREAESFHGTRKKPEAMIG
jgi:hypothetical protein